MGTQIFQKSKRHLKILGARRKIWSKFRTRDPQILGATYEIRSPWWSGAPDFWTSDHEKYDYDV